MLYPCPHADQHPRIDSNLVDHERRISKLEAEGREDRKELWVAVGRVEAAVQNMKGWLAGAMIAATLLGGIVAFIAQKALK